MIKASRFAILTSLVFALNALSSQTVMAQTTSGTTGSDEISFYLGNMLPSAIENVTEILPVFGGRYGLQTSRLGVAEFGLFNTHASGVDFTSLEASLRGDMAASAGMNVIYYGGLDFNYYRPENEEERKNTIGFHVGAGAMFQITDTVWLRGDLKFMGGPGQSLYLLAGLVFK